MEFSISHQHSSYNPERPRKREGASVEVGVGAQQSHFSLFTVMPPVVKRYILKVLITASGICLFYFPFRNIEKCCVHAALLLLRGGACVSQGKSSFVLGVQLTTSRGSAHCGVGGKGGPGSQPPRAGTRARVQLARQKETCFSGLILLLGIQASRETLNPFGATELWGAILL